jgi:acid phosphatase
MKVSRCWYLILYIFSLLSCRYIVNPGELIPESDPYIKDGGEYLELLAYGDAGKGSDNQQWTADDMNSYVSDGSNDIEFIINLGDSFYDNGVSSTSDPLWNSYFEDVYSPMVGNLPFYSILGNHDYRGSIDAQLEYEGANYVLDVSGWQMPARYYSFIKTLPDAELTTIEFFFIDTESLFYGDAEQLVWLDNKLSDSTARWKIVAGHRPLFSYGSHGFDGSLIPRLQPLLNNRADIYISGHEHDLQILGPLNNVYYIVNGSAGASSTTGVGDLTVFAAGRSGFMAFLISRDHLVCRIIETNSGVLYSLILKDRS